MSLERDLPLTYFNPCLREGGDQYGDEYQCNPADFNPRLREGGDPDVYFLIPSCKFQSTPPRRRRLQTKNYMRFLVLFQSTPPRRRRQCDPPHYDMDTVFQSTPPRRRRLHTWDGHSLLQHFNPRLREGGDFAQNIIGCFHFDFNPRLREGGDRNIL